MAESPQTMTAIALNNYYFHYLSAGDKSTPAVLFLHGFMGSSDDWQNIIDRLSSEHFCIAVDLPGHGRTEVKGSRRFYNMESTADALVRFLDELEIKKCILAGYSMGGRLALYLAARYPDRFRAAILESASPGLKTVKEREIRVQRDNALADALETGDFDSFLERWYGQPLFNSIKRNPNVRALLAKRRRNNPGQLALSLRYMGTGCQASLWELLGKIEIPVLLLAGELDTKFKKINTEMAGLCKTTTLEIAAGAGHNIHFENPEFFTNRIKKFLLKRKGETV